MSLLKIFKNRVLNCSYHFKDGTQAAFLNGKYSTDVKSRIEELQNEVDTNHPHIYIDPDEHEIDSEALSPMEVIRQEAYARAKADLLASEVLDKNKTSESDNGNFAASLTNTHNIAEGAAGSDSSNISEATGNVNNAPASATGNDLLGASAVAALAAIRSKQG